MAFPQLTPFLNPRGTRGYGEGSSLAVATRGYWSWWGQQVIVTPVDVFEWSLAIVRESQDELPIVRESEREGPIAREIRKKVEG